MRNCIVLGSGHSGARELAGMLVGVGYWAGDPAAAGRPFYPGGFFETRVIHEINERILEVSGTAGWGWGTRWLVERHPGDPLYYSSEGLARIQHAVLRQPFAFQDPRFSYTMPVWRPFLPEQTGMVCVFQHPAIIASNILKECQDSAYLADVSMTEARALRVVELAYKNILALHQTDKHPENWLFIHYDELIDPAGSPRLAQFLGISPRSVLADPSLASPSPPASLSPTLHKLYQQLCARSGYQPRDAAPGLPAVSVLCLVDDQNRTHLSTAVSEIGHQQRVEVEIIVIDQTTAGLSLPRMRVVRVGPGGLGRGLVKAALQCSHERVAVWDVETQPVASRLTDQAEALSQHPEVVLVTCDIQVCAPNGQGVLTSLAGQLFPRWESTLMVKRSWLSTVPETSFSPVLLRAYLETFAQPQHVRHLQRPLIAMARAYVAAGEGWLDRQLRAAEPVPEGADPSLSVVICTHNRKQVLVRCLEAICLQDAEPGSYELVLVDDGSTDGTYEMLENLDFPVPTTLIRRANGGVAAARNTALRHVRGATVLMIHDDTLASARLVRAHLGAHHSLAGRKVSVLGNFEPHPEVLDNALMRCLASEVHTAQLCDFSALEPGMTYDYRRYWTCNISTPTQALWEVGGFDERFRRHGFEDWDVGYRLELAGYRIFYQPDAQAHHYHQLTAEEFLRRQQLLGGAYGAFLERHPELVTQAGSGEEIKAAPEISEVWRRSFATLSALSLGAIEALPEAPEGWVRTTMGMLARVTRSLADRAWEKGIREGILHAQSLRLQDLARPPVAIELPQQTLLCIPGTQDWVSQILDLWDTFPDFHLMVAFDELPGVHLELLAGLLLRNHPRKLRLARVSPAELPMLARQATMLVANAARLETLNVEGPATVALSSSLPCGLRLLVCPIWEDAAGLAELVRMMALLVHRELWELLIFQASDTAIPEVVARQTLKNALHQPLPGLRFVDAPEEARSALGRLRLLGQEPEADWQKALPSYGYDELAALLLQHGRSVDHLRAHPGRGELVS